MQKACEIEEAARLDVRLRALVDEMVQVITEQAALWDLPAVDAATDAAMHGLPAVRRLTRVTAAAAGELWDSRRGDSA